MNFDDAIKAHVNWKIKLQSYLRNPDKSIKASEVECDDKCDLGKWIYSEGKSYIGMFEFENLKKDHARFHKEVGKIVRKADAGEKVEEDIAIGSKSEFAQASSAVVGWLSKMKLKKAA